MTRPYPFRHLLTTTLLMLTFAVGGHAAADTMVAQATLKDGDGNVVGTAQLRETPAGVLLHLKLSGLPAGAHALHFHETGECTPPFDSAGGHYNPDGKSHGLLDPKGPHAGDMPNIHVPASGELELEILSLAKSLNTDSGLMAGDGSAIIIHEGADDYMTDPAGAARARIACGVIEPT